MSIRRIQTHPGSAHKDDFLACSVLIHKHCVPVDRRDPTPEELEDPNILVVDVGGEHDPKRGNFDHHQLPRDHEPICALSLVLKHLDLYDDAKSFCDWLEPAEWLDSRGPVETAEWMNVERDVITKLVSPIDITMLRRFAMTDHLAPGDLLWEMMRCVGEDLVAYLTHLRGRLRYIQQHIQFWTLTDAQGQEFEVAFLPRTDPLPGEPGMGMPRFLSENGKGTSVVALVYPDRRGGGYALTRNNDNQSMEFTQIRDCEDVHFAHARGFIAKTSATTEDRLKDLLIQARIG